MDFTTFTVLWWFSCSHLHKFPIWHEFNSALGLRDRNSWYKEFEYTKANAALVFQCAGLLNHWLGMLRDTLDKVWACTYTGQHKGKPCTYRYTNGPTEILSHHPRTLHRPSSLCGEPYVRQFHLFDNTVWVDLYLNETYYWSFIVFRAMSLLTRCIIF
jgi:hypothetical protein